MSVTIRPYRGGGWEVDIRVVSPDGTRHKRERKHAPISSRSAVGRWAAGPGTRAVREASLSAKGSPTQGGAHPTRIRAAIRRRPRTGESTEAERDCSEDHDPSAVPDPGVRSTRHLDAIKSEDVQRLKAQLEIKSPKTVNNILAVLSILLKKAVEWDVIERMPCTDQAAAHREGRGGVPRLRGVRAARRRRTGNRSADVPDRVAGR